jgi:hypothetical protein
MAAVAALGVRAGAGLDLAGATQAGLARLVAVLAPVAESGAVAGSLAASGAFATLYVLFVPSRGPKAQWVRVGGPLNISYRQNPDELSILLRYTRTDGREVTEAASPDPNGDYRDPRGNIVGKILRVGSRVGIVFSLKELETDLDPKPRGCPAPVRDNGGELGTAYEDYAKAIINPDHPTPHNKAYEFWNPKLNKYIKIDDCQRESVAAFEYKGPGFAEHMIKDDVVWKSMVDRIDKQSNEQLFAQGYTHLTWCFEEKSVAEFFAERFKDERDQISVVWLPWPGAPKR